jgi:hypothetical protein
MPMPKALHHAASEHTEYRSNPVLSTLPDFIIRIPYFSFRQAAQIR